MKTPPENASATLPLRPDKLRCNGLDDPQAVQEFPPRLGWIVVGPGRGRRQSAYRICASTTRDSLAAGHPDLWDTGKVESSETQHIPYGGRPLVPGAPCWWTVEVWDEADRRSLPAAPACFARGLEPAAWAAAEWIGFDRARDVPASPAPLDDADWIWLSRNASAASETALFVGVLDLPSDAQVIDSQIAFAAAGRYEFYWGGEKFGMNEAGPETWRQPYVRHMNDRLGPGANRFLFRVEPLPGQPPALVFKATVRTRDGASHELLSGPAWRALPAGDHEWRMTGSPAALVALADRLSARAVSVGRYGDAPWGPVRSASPLLPAAAQLRREFAVKKPLRRAVLHATALGWFELRLNGGRVNESYFDPGWTDYAKRLHYRAYDVTDRLREGPNAWAVTLADGWFAGHIGWMNQRDLYGGNPRFLGRLRLEYEDGSDEIIASDRLWKAALGPVREADILMGETYDARLETPGWDLAGFDEAGWSAVDLGANLAPSLEAHPSQPVIALEQETFAPVAITSPEPGVHVFDLGQNFAGVVRLTLRGCERGRRIRIRHGERLRDDGTLYTENLRTARATDTYFCRGDAVETWSPRFTFHGFQFVEITGLPSEPEPDTVVGLPLSTGAPTAARFHTSDPLANRLAKNIYWSLRSNFIEVPTDCPQRDERLGWLDGPYTFIGAAAYWADVWTFFNKFNADLEDAQLDDGRFPWVAPKVVACLEHSGPFWSGSGPAWMDAGVICPWAVYQLYGDKAQLARRYASMRRLIDYYVATSPDLLPPAEFQCLGDWLNQGGEIPPEVFRTAYFARSVEVLSRAAAVLGLAEDALRYGQLFQSLRSVFQRAYVEPSGRIRGDAQGCYALAIEFDLLDDGQRDRAATRLVEKLRESDGLLTTGLEATLPLMRSLSRMGRSDLAYALLHEERYPSWNFTIKAGATTIWERWNSWTPGRGFGDVYMNSFNHFTLGSVFQWMMENIGGILPLEPGYRSVLLAPQPGGRIESADVAHATPLGLVTVKWIRRGRRLSLSIGVPANVSAELALPGPASAAWTDDAGAPVPPRAGPGGSRRVALASGDYAFSCEDWAPAPRRAAEALTETPA